MTPGKNSTEFWLIIACGVMLLANGSEYVNVPWTTLQWFFGLTGLYTGARQIVKREDVKATVVPNGEQRTMGR